MRPSATPAPKLRPSLEHPSTSVSAEVVIALLERPDRRLAAFDSITLPADRGFPSAELLGWVEAGPRRRDVVRLRGDAWIQGIAAPMGCQVRRLRLPRGHWRGFRGLQPWALVSNLDAAVELAWSYAQRLCCERLFRDQKPGIFLLERSGLGDPGAPRSVAVGGCDRRAGPRRPVDPHWRRGMSVVRIGLACLQPLEPRIPSRGVRRRRKQPGFRRIELPHDQDRRIRNGWLSHDRRG